MKALWLDGDPTLRTDIPAPRPGPGEALVGVRLAGVCGTDLALLRGYVPFVGVPGHEFVGRILAAPDAPQRVGERVVAEINLACGHCPDCRAGRRTHCANRRVAGIRRHDGAFAEYIVLPLVNLLRVPDAVPDTAAVFAEPLAAALRAAEQLAVGPSTSVLVVGAGRLGQLVARVLALRGCALRVVARHPRQRALLDGVGIAWIAEDAVPMRAVDVVVEATGSPAGFELARRAVRPQGVLCLKSTYRERVDVDPASLVVDEITLVGSRCGPFPAALRLLEQDLVDPTPLIDECVPLEDGVRALARAAEPGVVKVLIECTGTPVPR